MSNESRALVVQQPLNLSTWQVIQAVAPTMHQSRLFGVASAEQAAAIMIKGAELGLSLSASFEFVQVVQGKPTLSPRGALALVMNSGLLGGLKITETDDACTIWMKRKGNPELEYEFTWTQAESERAGLVKAGDKGVSAHISYPKLMRKWRAVGFCIDFLFSDVCGGMKRADEFGAVVDNAGDVVEAQWSVPAATQPPPEPLAVAVTLDDLVGKYGADKVMEAAGGRIPGSLDEVAQAAAALEAVDA